MAPKSSQDELPIQPVEEPVLCRPYDEPDRYWHYDEFGQATTMPQRRPAGYYYKDQAVGTGQRMLGFAENFDELTLVNRLREDVKRWRESGYRGATNVTRELLRHWTAESRERRLFFCQREAVETIIYMAELRLAGRSSRSGFSKFSVTDEDIALLLSGRRPTFQLEGELFPTLIDRPAELGLQPLTRMACKMATGSGKTVVMAMLITWAFCNRGQNPQSKEFPHAALICCPNLTVKERLQVLRPDHKDNYYEAFDIVPTKYKEFLRKGLVLLENWHQFAPESEHKEGDASYAVVDKGPEDVDSFARRVLGDLYDRMPIMVLNDEGHHCWRPAPDDEKLDKEEKQEVEKEKAAARVWLAGLDRLNNALGDKAKGVLFCVDLSATPFYIKGSGHPEGRPFPWVVSDFGLVDAIECGIVKIPRLPVSDTTGRPDPKYFQLWRSIVDNLEPANFLPGKGKRPKPEVVYREAQPALVQMYEQWKERFDYIVEAKPEQDTVPPVMIVVCANTEIAEVFFRNISGQREEEIATEEDLQEALAEEEGKKPKKAGKKKGKKQTRTVYSVSQNFPEFSNTPERKYTERIDSKLLNEAESDDPKQKKSDAAESLRRIIATVGKKGEPGEHVRCVVSVSMLTEGWDASNVTHIFGVRAFDSQLLCEQVVGRGLRRMNYDPDKETGKLPEEYVDVYGIPFSVIPYRGRPVKQPEQDDRPLNHVRALPERAHMEMRFPVVEGYAFQLRRNVIACDVDEMEVLEIEPNKEPTATYLQATIGYAEGSAASVQRPFGYVQQDREQYYAASHIQQIMFGLSRTILDQLTNAQPKEVGAKQRVINLQSRHQLFPQIYRIVEEYVQKKVLWRGAHHCELGLEKYAERVIERIRDGIYPDESQGEPPLLPILNKHKPIGTTADVDFKTKRACRPTQRSHVNQVVLDTQTWEATATFRLEQPNAPIQCYVRNDHLGLTIPYEYMGVDHHFSPDFVVRLANGLNLLMEVKGFEDDQTKAKHNAAKRWVRAVNNWGQLGYWDFRVVRDVHAIEGLMRHLNNIQIRGEVGAATV